MLLLLKVWTRRCLAWGCGLMTIASGGAWATLYRDGMFFNQSGHGIATLSWGNQTYGLELTLDGSGVQFERNPSLFSYYADEPRRLSWKVQDAPFFLICGTGSDEYRQRAEFSWHGLTYLRGERVTWLERRPPRPHVRLAIPHWLVISAAIPLPALRAARWYRRRRRFGDGMCRNCGYDLRATPARCPECGTVPSAAPPL